MAKLKFFSAKGKETDILHSMEFLSKSFKERADMAFDKELRKDLSKKDAALLNGYAQSISERSQAFKFKNPNYKSKSKNNNK